MKIRPPPPKKRHDESSTQLSLAAKFNEYWLLARYVNSQINNPSQNNEIYFMYFPEWMFVHVSCSVFSLKIAAPYWAKR